jgi:hypothetical protein
MRLDFVQIYGGLQFQSIKNKLGFLTTDCHGTALSLVKGRVANNLQGTLVKQSPTLE